MELTWPEHIKSEVIGFQMSVLVSVMCLFLSNIVKLYVCMYELCSVAPHTFNLGNNKNSGCVSFACASSICF